MRGWLGQVEGIQFNEYLTDYRNEVLDKLTKESDSVRFHRLQGNLEVINNIIELRGEMDSYISGLASGKMRKITNEKENENGVGREEVRTGRA